MGAGYLTPTQVQRLRARAHQLRSARPRTRDATLARELLFALRAPMFPLGPTAINPDLCDEYEAAEAEYRHEMQRAYPALMRYRQPVQRGELKFHVAGRWYGFTQARAVIREALEVDRPRAKRSRAAQWLATALHGDSVDDYALEQAQPKLLWIVERLRPLSS